MSVRGEDLFQMHDLAAHVGRDGWVERRLFEVLGRWSTDSTDDPVAVHFANASRRHGWHAQLCMDRLPELASLDAEALIVPAGDATRELFERLGSLTGDAERLVAFHDAVLPAVLVRHRRLVARVPPVSGASIIRWYGFMISDDTDELLDGFSLRSDLDPLGAGRAFDEFTSLVAASATLSR